MVVSNVSPGSRRVVENNVLVDPLNRQLADILTGSIRHSYSVSTAE